MNTTPSAWLIRETRADKSSILCGHMFKSEAVATSAATRMSSQWRKCEAVAVYERPGQCASLRGRPGTIDANVHADAALVEHLRAQVGVWLAVRVDGAVWEVVTPRTQEAILAAVETTPDPATSRMTLEPPPSSECMTNRIGGDDE